MRNLILLFSVLFLLTSCATSEFMLTGEQHPAFTGDVKILFKEPLTEYEHIGIVSARETEQGVSWNRLLTMIKDKAASYGANAIILSQPKESSELFGAFFSGTGGLFSSSHKELIGIAIKIL